MGAGTLAGRAHAGSRHFPKPASRTIAPTLRAERQIPEIDAAVGDELD